MSNKYELIIAEKTDAARRIAEALSNNIQKHLYKNVPYFQLDYDGKNIIVAAAVGHLFNLTEKEKSGSYPIFDLVWKPSYLVSKQAAFTKKYYDALKKISKEASSLVNACDYDSEGSLIGWTVINFICNKKDAKRMKFSTLVKEELIDSYNNADSHLDFPQIESGEARHELDWVWGINNSRALILAIKNTGKGFKILSSGRVQSPVLALLAHREKEIESFKPIPYWQLFALIIAKDHELLTIHKKDKFWEEKEVKSIYNKCKAHDAKIIKVIRKQSKLLPPPPFNITSLQTESYKNFKFSPQETLNIAEKLYLSAYISYPRTSSEQLDPRINYKSILKALSNNQLFSKFANELLKKDKLSPKQGVKTDPAHIAIYPTNNLPNFSKLDDGQKKVYSLIVKRFLSCFADPALRESMEIDFDINKEIFFISGARTLQQGWLSYYQPYIKLKEITLPELKENEIHKVKKLELKKDETKPPSRFTQGSIIAEMEKRNLGTRSTRSMILQILYNRHYIEGKSIQVTQLGKAVASTLEKYVPDLVSEKLTRHFEKELEQIQEQTKTKEEVLEEAKITLTKIFKHFKENESKIGMSLLEAVQETRKQESLVGKCPECKGNLVIKRGKYGSFVACDQYPKCKVTFSVPNNALIKPTNTVCDSCGYPVVMVIRKGKRPFNYCLNSQCPKKLEWIKNNIKS